MGKRALAVSMSLGMFAATSCASDNGPSPATSAGDSLGSGSAAASSDAGEGSIGGSGSGTPEDGAEESGVPSACDGLVASGNAVGDVAENWTLGDRDGNPVSLWDYCGKVIFIEDGAEW